MSPKMINYKLWQTFRVSVNFWLKVGENSYPYSICQILVMSQIESIKYGTLGWANSQIFKKGENLAIITMKTNYLKTNIR